MNTETVSRETAIEKYFSDAFPIVNKTITGTTHGRLRYQIVFGPRYRRKIFNYDKAKDIFSDIAYRCAAEKNFTIVDMEFMPDCVSMTVDAEPDLCPKEIQSVIKNASSRPLLENVRELARAKTLWTKNYFATSETLDDTLSPKERALRYMKRQPRQT